MRKTKLRTVGRRVLALATVLAAGGFALRAQEPGFPEEFAPVANLNGVGIEAVVTDRAGRRVRDLKATDFRLKVDGRETPVELWTEVSHGEAGTSYLIFLDDFYTRQAQRNQVLTSLEKDLRLGPGDQAAVVLYDGSPHLLTSWTPDADRVRQVLSEVRGRPIRRFSTVLNPGPEAAGAAVAVALRGMPRPPGRKVLLLVSGGWPEIVARSESGGGPPEATQLFEPVAETANLLDYTTYLLEIPSAYLEAEIPALSWSPTFSDRFSLVETEGDLEEVARRTGGRAIPYSQRKSAFAQVVEDAASYYTLTFSPAWKGDGRRHSIRVEVGRPELSVRTRDGYFDRTPELQELAARESRVLFDRGGTAKAEAGIQRITRAGIELPVTLWVPARRLTAVPAPGGFEVRAIVSAFTIDSRGGAGREPDVPVGTLLAEAPGPDDLVPFAVSLHLKTLDYRLSFVVEDEGLAGVSRGQLDYNYHPKG